MDAKSTTNVLSSAEERSNFARRFQGFAQYAKAMRGDRYSGVGESPETAEQEAWLERVCLDYGRMTQESQEFVRNVFEVEEVLRYMFSFVSFLISRFWEDSTAANFQCALYALAILDRRVDYRDWEVRASKLHSFGKRKGIDIEGHFRVAAMSSSSKGRDGHVSTKESFVIYASR